MATPAEIVTAIETAMASRATSGAAGVVSVTIDGVSTSYSFDEAVKALQFWERRAAVAAGKRRLVNTLDLRNV